MAKKCIICSEEAVFTIKDTSDYYCEDCADEQFADVSMLIKIEEQARKLKEVINQKQEEMEDTENNNL